MITYLWEEDKSKKCSEKYMGLRGIKDVSNSEYYITRNFIIYTGHPVLFG
jgi:hypothetical protein